MRHRPIAHLGARVLLALLLVAPHLPASPAPAQAQPATIVVSTSADSGPGSLRQAILDANATAGLDTIRFSIGSGAQVITPTTALPIITGPVIVDGTTQPGYAGTPLIALDGGAIAEDADALHITAGGSTVRGLAIYNFGRDGIELAENGGNLIERNVIGPLGLGGNGASVHIRSSHNTVGGTGKGAGNVLKHAEVGILVASGTGNALLGNQTPDSAKAFYSRPICFERSASDNNCGRYSKLHNDPLDRDSGPNNLQNAPRIISAVVGDGVISIAGWFNGAPDMELRLEFFAGAENRGGTEQMDRYLGFTNIRTDASGNARFTAVVPGDFPVWNTLISATATDARNNTSGVSNPAYLGSTYTVTTTVDSGPGSLRHAIASGAKLIRFNIAGGGPQTIRPLSPLPKLQGGLIDGTTQPGYAGTPLIELDGSLAGTDAPGLRMSGFQGSGVRGLAINRFSFIGIWIDEYSADSLVEGCYIGADLSGTGALGNAFTDVYIDYSAQGGSMIGGTWPGAGNLFAQNNPDDHEYGLWLLGKHHLVQNNLFGTDASGTQAIGGAHIWIRIWDHYTYDNLIGGPAPASGNVIAGAQRFLEGGHDPAGIYVEGGDNTIQGNAIGTNANGTLDFGNEGHGIWLAYGASNNSIGGDKPGEGNIIAHNDEAGILVDGGQRNRIQGNEIFDNGGLDIDLGGDGVTPNDAGDGDVGSNGLQNFPVISGVELQGSPVDSVTITGTLSSKPSTTYWLEFFEDTHPTHSPWPNRQFYLGRGGVTTDASGLATFVVTLPRDGVERWSAIRATATDPAGNTSELSPPAPATPQPPTYPTYLPLMRLDP